MKNFSVNSLFPESDFKKNMDINTLFNSSNDFDSFAVENLIKERESKIKHVKKIYKDMLNTCFEKIQILNSRDETDLIFKVPSTYFGARKYSSIDCLAYLEKKLRKKYFDTYIISEDRIFVSWKNIEANMSLEKIIE